MTETATAGVTSEPLPQTGMEEPQIAHLAGVFDIGGSITVQITEDDNYAVGYQLRPGIRMSRAARGEDDPLFGKIAAYAEEVGARYQIYNEQTDGDDVIRREFVITDPHSVEQFLEPLAEFFVNRYDVAELMLNVVLPAIKEDEHHEKEGFLRLMPAADMIRAESNRSAKYDTAYFESEWDMDAEELLA